MTDQKSKWAAKAAQYNEWAATARDEAEKLSAPLEALRGDVAFFTQPGRIVARERVFAQSQRANDLHKKAALMEQKAANLERMATTNAGDAVARHKAADAAVINSVRVGDMVRSVYGVLPVVKINRKSLSLKGAFGIVRIDAHLCRKVAA